MASALYCFNYFDHKDILFFFNTCSLILMLEIKKKVVVVGNHACGKTSFLSVLKFDQFPKLHEPNIFYTYFVDIKVNGMDATICLADSKCEN